MKKPISPVLGVLILLGGLGTCCVTPFLGTQQGNTASQMTAPFPPTGDVATARCPEVGMVPIAIDAQAFARFSQLIRAKDAAGIEQLDLAGLTFNIPNGRQVRVIDGGMESSGVRIMSGESAGRSGFVFSSILNKN